MSAPVLTQPLAAARVVSATPGRLRLRLPEGVARPERLAAAAEALAALADVSVAVPRPRTGSLVVEFDTGAAQAVRAALRELGLATPSAPTDGDPEGVRVLGVLSRANDLVARRTKGPDLRTLVPVGLGMLALRQLVRGEQRLVNAPWYVLAWYASETFQKFHAQQRGE